MNNRSRRKLRRRTEFNSRPKKWIREFYPDAVKRREIQADHQAAFDSMPSIPNLPPEAFEYRAIVFDQEGKVLSKTHGAVLDVELPARSVVWILADEGTEIQI